MFDYTKAAWQKTKEDLNKLGFAINLSLELIYIAYLIYAIIIGSGLFIINIILGILCIAHLVFYLSITKFGKDPACENCKFLKKWIASLFKWSKRVIRLVTISFAVYDIITTDENDLISLLLTGFMIIGWILGIIADVVIKILKDRVTLMIDGIEMDVLPAIKILNFFKKMRGEEVEENIISSKNESVLKEKAEKMREEKTAKKVAYKLQKTEDKQRKKQEEKQLKQSTKAEKALLKAAKKKEKLEKREK